MTSNPTTTTAAAAGSTSTTQYITYYQNSIENSENDRKRLLHCIGKLYNLEVTLQDLQVTGIGRTVNALRKDDGEVGVAAKALVNKWKAMVADEESKKIENQTVDGGGQSSSSSSSSSGSSSGNESSSSSNSSSSSSKPKKHHKKDSKMDNHSSSSSNNNNSHTNNHTTTTNNNNNHNNSSTSGGDSKSKSTTKHHHSSGGSSSKDENLSQNGNKSDKRDGHHHNHHNHHNHHSGSSSTKSSSSKSIHHNSSSSSSSRNGHRSDAVATKSTESNRKDRKSDSKTSSTSTSTSTSSSSHKSSSKSSSSSSRHHNHHHHTHNNHRGSQENGNENNSSTKQQHHRHSEKSEMKLVDSDVLTMPTTPSKHKLDTTDSASPSKSKRVKSEEKPKFESIDSTMGTSFADALGMMEPPRSTTKLSKSKKPSATSTSGGSSSSSSSSSSSRSKSSSSFSKLSSLSSSSSPSSLAMSSKQLPKSDNAIPKLPTTPDLLLNIEQLEPLHIDIESELPKITNNYKPMPLNPIVMDCVFNASANHQLAKRFMPPEESTLTDSFSSKNARTKVYSGNKSTDQTIPTLMQLCTRVLQKNIDALEYTGGVPFEILKPILERATPEQLLTFEHYNPYLVVDSDVLWKEHVRRTHRSAKKDEFESFREMFLRCKDEQEARLAKLTMIMKQTQREAIPAKKTKLAYVDSAVKPPRNIQKKQIQYGTERKMIATPAARVESLKNSATNIASIGDTRLKVLAGIRDTAQTVAIPVRPKMAPLMAKSLQLMKGRFRR